MYNPGRVVNISKFREKERQLARNRKAEYGVMEVKNNKGLT